MRQPAKLSECLDSVDSSTGRARVAAYLAAQPYPHFEPMQDSPGLLMRIDANGKRTLGRFVNRQFKAARKKPRKR
jgi:hypothetical protein